MPHAPTEMILAMRNASPSLPISNIYFTAEAQLQQAQRDPSHLLEVLKLVASADACLPQVRQAAAVHFKNTIKKGWDVNREDGNEGIVISDADRNTIKSHLVQLMCTVPPLIQSLLSESISLIAEVDYPDRWGNLLPELVQQFDSTDISTVTGVLKSCHSIFSRFRYVARSNELYAVILYTLNIIQAPLLTLFRSTAHAVQIHSNDAAALKQLLEVLQHICFIYYSLVYQDLPEYFEDHMTEWMSDFAIFLQYKNAILVDDDEEENPGPIDNLQVAVIEILLFFATNDEEAFMDFLPKFTTLVWDLLTHVTPHPKHDALATKSIKFLSTLIQKPMHKQLFQDDAILRQIVGKIVIANLTFRQSDEERFEDDPREFIVTEVEGSDSESRRRCSQDLLRSMCRLFETETVAICSEHIASLLAEYTANPHRTWAAKDAAVSRRHDLPPLRFVASSSHIPLLFAASSHVGRCNQTRELSRSRGGDSRGKHHGVLSNSSFA
jgi:exportin-2 (importin alpha re-exporter)